MQGLVYLFIGLASLAIGVGAHFALGFSIIEAFLAAVLAALVCMFVLERQLRRRAEKRLEKGVEDLSRLLSRDAQAGQLLSQRINSIADLNPGKRLDTLEADISVLGTVIRQVAEAVAEVEERRSSEEVPAARTATPEQSVAPLPTPKIPAQRVRFALDENRLLCHVAPIITLPQRRPYGYDVVPRLLLEDGAIAESRDFMPLDTDDELLRRVEGMAINEAISLVRRARAEGQSIVISAPISSATLGDPRAMDQVLVAVDANRTAIQGLAFAITHKQWNDLNPPGKSALALLVKKGASISIAAAETLRLDFSDLAARGVRSVRVDATRFVNQPTHFTDFHASDIGSYLKRYGIELMASDIRDEQQIISVLEDGVGLAQGNHIAAPGPVRADMFVGNPTPPAPRRLEV